MYTFVEHCNIQICPYLLVHLFVIENCSQENHHCKCMADARSIVLFLSIPLIPSKHTETVHGGNSKICTGCKYTILYILYYFLSISVLITEAD